MPLDKNIKKVLVIGSGPIIIGQAAEFDYAGTQACRVLKQDNIEIVLVNSNPATIMTDSAIADRIYIEPLTLTTVKRIIEKERPDSILSSLGGQTGLTLCMQLAKDGFLEKMNVRLLGSSPETIDKAEDRQIFKETMQKIGQPVIPSAIANDINTAYKFADENGYPVIIRPAFTLGGTGGGFAHDKEELAEIGSIGLDASPIHQILVEKSVAGWKEIEFEGMRDKSGNVITVCSMENVDPVGIHTGDSIVVAPAVTLSNVEYEMLRAATLDIITSLGVEGGCNVQFALYPDSLEYAVIEVNPRVSRSSALASKATGYPIAKVATKVAIGYNLDEIVNAVTGTTYAAFEPTIDYIAIKFPKWPFDKFVYAKKDLGTQMKATGEVMSTSDTFEDALLKAVRGAELGLSSLEMPKLKNLSDENIRNMLHSVTDERLFVIYEALKRGVGVDEIYDITKIDEWFLSKIKNIADNPEKYDNTGKSVVYKMVDTCAGEYAAQTPYFYAIPAGNTGIGNEALEFIERSNKSNKERILVLGSGPIRIGQGIEFDYACVHCVWSLKKMGYEVIVINNNPETVSTDFDTADRLYFEPLTIDDVMRVINIEKPIGVIVAFGGGTAIKLTQKLAQRGVKILGTSDDSIDICEDRKRFDKLLEDLHINRPKGFAVMTEAEALKAAENLGYPVLMRPSYVLGGQNMIIAYEADDITEYMEIILRQKQDNPVLIDKYMSGREIEVDAICDGKDILIPGIMEHIERTGIHSGDSIAMYPAAHIDDKLAKKIFDVTEKICTALDVRGLVNLQYVISYAENSHGDIYVIEVNPRASRTVPYISKITGIQMCELATRTSLGETLESLGYKSGIGKIPPYVAVKVPVFSFEKLADLDTQLGPEMKSTGEVLGIGKDLREALYKGLLAAGYKLSRHGGVFITVRNSDKDEIADIARKFALLGFELYATKGTGDILKKAGLPSVTINKIHESGENNSMTIIESGKINYVISTSAKGRDPARDSVKIRRKACMLRIPCMTSLDTANAIADSLLSHYGETNTEIIDISRLRSEHMELKFTKMESAGNDYIYIDRFESGAQEINSPESLSIFLSDRHYGVGGDGVVLILPPTDKDNADARMRTFNLDGSEGWIGGNGIRCVAKYLYDNKLVDKLDMKIETFSGIRELSLETQNGLVSSVCVNMGKAEFAPEKIPAKLSGDKIVNRKIDIDGRKYSITCVSMGNPHCVVFFEDSDSGGEHENHENLDMFDIDKTGPQFEYNPIFPARVNAEFVQIINKNTLKMRVWERGSGETLSCGTGACAAAVAAVLNGYMNKGEDIRVILKGGELTVNYTDECVYLTGGCRKVFEGTVLL
ncbi:MAG: carbamoyl-phosphate synthase large subunit [Oscillospiraceae bacterium]|nr:carbamoyl-phosphate synthase large subunit [Oscillospiraceae bacterium]